MRSISIKGHVDKLIEFLNKVRYGFLTTKNILLRVSFLWGVNHTEILKLSIFIAHTQSTFFKRKTHIAYGAFNSLVGFCDQMKSVNQPTYNFQRLILTCTIFYYSQTKRRTA